MNNKPDLFSSKSGDQGYMAAKQHAPKECQDQLNSAYHSVLLYLDDNFNIEFPNNYSSRCWELFVADKIFRSPLRDNLISPQEWRGKDDKGPDYKISHPKAPLYIEVVCPHEADENKRFPATNFTYSEEFSEIGPGSSTASSGEDEYIISRFTSSLKDKACKFKEYLASGIIASSSYKILFVGGNVLAMGAAKTYGSRSNSLSQLMQFECAVYGKRKTAFVFDHKRNYLGIEQSYENLQINKGKGAVINLFKFQECLKIFDIIIYSELNPFLSASSKPFDFYYKEKRIEDALRACIGSIFR